MTIETVKIEDLHPYARNARTHPQKQVDLLAKNIMRFGFTTPVLIDEDNNVIAGHGRLLAMQQLSEPSVPCVRIEGLTEAEVQALRLADNKIAELGEWDMDLALPELKGLDQDLLELTGFSLDLQRDGEGNATLGERFLFPPFSVLNAREGGWQDRKRNWLSLGIKSEEGRDIANTSVGKDAPDYMANRGNNQGGSIFDPTLCEVIYQWFCPTGGTVLDPFAGGSVRGIVASKLGLKYTGIELRGEQVEANIAQGATITPENPPIWIQGDSNVAIPKEEYDFVFTCPPYADLEVYSDDPADLSNMAYEEFLEVYRSIIKKAVAQLKEDRFACVVVGEVRDKNGIYYNFVGDTTKAFIDAGMSYYNEAILVTAVGSLPVRAARQFNSGRKLGKTHQNILVYYKGNPKQIKGIYGEIDLSSVKEEEMSTDSAFEGL